MFGTQSFLFIKLYNELEGVEWVLEGQRVEKRGVVIGILAAVSYVLTKYAPKSESRSLLTVMD